MIGIPLNPLPSQFLTVTLNNQAVRLNIYQKFYGLFMDVLVNDQLVIGGVVCEDRNRIVRSKYFNFLGDFAFFDTQGSSDPDYTGLGSRFILVYLTLTDLAAMGFDA